MTGSFLPSLFFLLTRSLLTGFMPLLLSQSHQYLQAETPADANK